MAVSGPPGKKKLYGAEGAQALDTTVQSHVKGVLEGKVKRFSDETVSKMKQGLFETTRGQAKQQRRSLRSAMARSGTFRSGALLQGGMDIEREASAEYSRGVRDIMLKKAQAEFDDKSQAISQAQTWLKQKQDYDLGLRQMETQIETAQIQAGATLGAAKLGADASIRAAGMSAGAARYAAKLRFDIGDRQLNMAQERIDAQRNQLGLG